MPTVESQGTTFEVSDGQETPVFNPVGQVTSITGLRSGQATEINVTDLSSLAQEFRMGLADEGTMQIAVNYDPADTDGQNRLEALRDSREQGDFKIVLPDMLTTSGTTFEFSGFVTAFPFDVAADDVLRGTVSVRVTGQITKTPAA